MDASAAHASWEIRDYFTCYTTIISTATLVLSIIKYYTNKYRLLVIARGEKPYGYYLLPFQGEDWRLDTISVRLVARNDVISIRDARVNLYPSKRAKRKKRPIWSGMVIRRTPEDTSNVLYARKSLCDENVIFCSRLEKNSSLDIPIFVHADLDATNIPAGEMSSGIMEFEVLDDLSNKTVRCEVSLPKGIASTKNWLSRMLMVIVRCRQSLQENRARVREETRRQIANELEDFRKAQEADKK